MRLLALAGLGLSIYLAYVSFQAGAVGCGAGGCDQVIHTSWGKILNIPIGVPAAVMYLIALIATLGLGGSSTKLAWCVLAVIGVLAVGAAAWFTFLQRVEIGVFCPFCMAAHGVGIAFALVVFASGPWPWALGKAGKHTSDAGFGWSYSLVLVAIGLFGVASMAGVQRFFPSDTMQVERTTGSSNIPIQGGLKPGQVVFNVGGGAIVFEPAKYPIKGAVDAEHMLITLFDFTCPHCRNMHAQSDKVTARYGKQVAFVMLPMPLDSQCNRLMTQTDDRHKGACDYARLSIAVWLAKPEAWHPFADYVMEGDTPPSVEDARAKAAELIGEEELAEAMVDERVDNQLNRNITLYEVTRAGPLPKIIGDSLLIFGRPGSDEEFYRVIETELNLTPQDGSAPAPQLDDNAHDHPHEHAEPVPESVS